MKEVLQMSSYLMCQIDGHKPSEMCCNSRAISCFTDYNICNSVLYKITASL